jgi:hypothetical protein
MKKVDERDEGVFELKFEEDCCEEEECRKEPSALWLVFDVLSFCNEGLDLDCVVISECEEVVVLVLCCLADTSPASFLFDTFGNDAGVGEFNVVVVAFPLLVPLLLPLLLLSPLMLSLLQLLCWYVDEVVEIFQNRGHFVFVEVGVFDSFCLPLCKREALAVREFHCGRFSSDSLAGAGERRGGLVERLIGGDELEIEEEEDDGVKDEVAGLGL